MKKLLVCLLSFLWTACSAENATINVDSVYKALDNAIARQAIYDTSRKTKIAELKNLLRKARGDYEKTYVLNEQISEGYKAYCYDSIACYLNRNYDLAEAHHDVYRLGRVQLKLAYLFASSGMYLEAVNIINLINPKTLPHDLLVDYYTTCSHLYGEVACYTHDNRAHQYYIQLKEHYNNLIMKILPKNLPFCLNILEVYACYHNRGADALKYNSMQMGKVSKDSQEYSIICYFRSVDYKQMGNKQMEKYWLGMSAINDVKNAVKDQAALWTLASLLDEEGSIERAYRYIRFSWEVTRFYNAPLRNLQSSGVLSMVDDNYQMMIEKQNVRLRNLLILTTVLTILLVIAIGYVYIQMKRLAEARNKLHVSNDHLTDLNSQLLDSNKIKDEYIGRFLSLCSFYIDKLDGFRNTVIKKAKAGQVSEYLTSSKIRALKDEDLEDLLRNFDHAFLCLVPNFVEEFNKLLKPEVRIKPDSSELLNTELRLFALIRLGVEDSSKIAEFLHYSVNTIYNYRAKVKSSAIVSRDEFEKRVKEIGRV